MKIKKMQKNEKTCSACGKPYEYAIKVYYEKEGARCEHDSQPVTIPRRYTSYEQQKEFLFKKENPFKKVLGPK